MDKNKIYDYQLQLITRRWQYFATYLFIVGLFLNAIPNGCWENLPSCTIPSYLKVMFLVIPIILGIVFCHLVGLTTKRIDQIEISLKQSESITLIKVDGKFFGLSETILVYFSIYLIISFLIFLIFKINVVLAVIISTIAIFSLPTLNWKSMKREENNIE